MRSTRAPRLPNLSSVGGSTSAPCVCWTPPAQSGRTRAMRCRQACFSATALVQCGYHFEHLWSLAVEEQFYLFWPLLLVVSPMKLRAPFWIVRSGLGFRDHPVQLRAWLDQQRRGVRLHLCRRAVRAEPAPAQRFRTHEAGSAALWIWVLLLVVLLPFARTLGRKRKASHHAAGPCHRSSWRPCWSAADRCCRKAAALSGSAASV